MIILIGSLFQSELYNFRHSQGDVTQRFVYVLVWRLELLCEGGEGARSIWGLRSPMETLSQPWCRKMKAQLLASSRGEVKGGASIPELLGIRLMLVTLLASSSSQSCFPHSLFSWQHVLNKPGFASWEHILRCDPWLFICLIEIPTGLEMVLTYYFPSQFWPQVDWTCLSQPLTSSGSW